MAVTVRDVSKVDVVLLGVELLKSLDEMRSFRDSADVDVHMGSGTATEASTGETHSLTAVTLQRERIIINSFPGRSFIIKEYPSVCNPDPDWDRLAEVATLAISCTDPAAKDPRAFGYNLALVMDVNQDETAAIFLGNQILTSRPLGRAGWGLVGGAGSVTFSDGDRRWTFNLQPQPAGDPDSRRITYDVNLHVQDARIPDQREISDTLKEVWTDAKRFIERLSEVERHDG